MGKKYQATFKCYVTVEFEDMGELALVDQADDELQYRAGFMLDDSELIEIVEVGAD